MDLKQFDFDGINVRFYGDKPIANDVAKALGYANPAKTISTKVDQQYKGVTEMVTPGGAQQVTYLEEPGIYQLIFGSKVQSAKKFQKWVFEVVLPSIRSTGGYAVSSRIDGPITADLLTQAISQALAPILEGMNQRISKLEEKAEEVQPLLPPPVNPRKEISRVIRNHVNAQGTGDYGRCFRELYTEYKYRTGIDLVQRAKNRGVDALDYAEAEDLIGQVVSLAREMYP